MKTNVFIGADNTKAIEHFNKLGVKLVRGTKELTIVRAWDIWEELTLDVYYVIVDMSGRAFHRYLVNNGISKPGSAPVLKYQCHNDTETWDALAKYVQPL